MIKTERYVEFTANHLNCRLIPVTEEIIRCIVSKKEICQEAESLIIEKKEYDPVLFETEECDGSVILKTAKVQAAADLTTGVVTWKHPDGSVWLQEAGKDLTEIDVIRYITGGEKPVINRVKTVDGERNFILNLKEQVDRKAYRARLFFQWKEDEDIHGLGQAEEGIYNYRGHNQYLYQHNMRIPMPVFTSTEGYGILVDCCSIMTYNDDGKHPYLFMDTVVFVREGSILPTVEGIQYASQKPEKPMKITVYPGADGEFTLYEDEGNNYHFEQGAYAMTVFRWNDRKHEFTAAARQGSYPGMEELSYTVEIAE